MGEENVLNCENPSLLEKAESSPDLGIASSLVTDSGTFEEIQVEPSAEAEPSEQGRPSPLHWWQRLPQVF